MTNGRSRAGRSLDRQAATDATPKEAAAPPIEPIYLMRGRHTGQ
jgi:hypothetical protein